MEMIRLLFEHPWWTTLWLFIICGSLPTAFVIQRGKK